jgi:hypothetical protein
VSGELLRINDDLWCLWNDIADAPEIWGTRQEVWTYLYKKEDDCHVCGHNKLTERFDRAEAKGTSAMWYEGPPKGFVYDQRGWLPWERMEAFLTSYDEGFDITLLDPFEA